MFEPYVLGQAGRLLSAAAAQFPVEIHAWRNGDLHLPDGATYYGMITEGSIFLRSSVQDFYQTLTAGMFFCLPGQITLRGREGAGLVIAAHGYRGYPQLGGPLEARGRLRYIDGCSDTLLVTAPVVGEPCLNHLHIPPGTDQTSHTHPSERIGVILRGSGCCKTPEGHHPLSEGMGWRIPPGQVHSFHTGADEFLDVIAWHPDSDFGPSHHDHPMVNRTYVDEVPASRIEAIQTKEIA